MVGRDSPVFDVQEQRITPTTVLAVGESAAKMARRLVTFGLHVHVGVDSGDNGRWMICGRRSSICLVARIDADVYVQAERDEPPRHFLQGRFTNCKYRSSGLIRCSCHVENGESRPTIIASRSHRRRTPRCNLQYEGHLGVATVSQMQVFISSTHCMSSGLKMPPLVILMPFGREPGVQ